MHQLTLQPKKQFQTIEGFGASGAWWAQLVGGWPDETRREIMRLLYCKEHGLGMQIYRYNLGGGSKESDNGIYCCPRRRASDFLAPDGSYDWSRDAEALWCLREAVRLGADEVVFFVNSPPQRWTVSGMAQAKIPFRANLKREHELDFTNYVLDVTEHFLAEGIPVKFVSPINEPLGPWSGRPYGQEGCHYHPRGVRRLMRLFAQEMDQRPALNNTLLSGAENNDLRLFNKTYTRAVMNDPVVRTRLDGVDVHGYVFEPLKCLKGADVKRRFRRWMDKKYPGEKIRMTEWTEMQGGRDTGMESALVLANEVFEDLAITGVVSWQKWIAVSEYDFCDGLIYINPEQQSFELPKRYFAFGHFTKFVPREAVRIGIDAPANLQALAFTCDSHTAVILINHSDVTMELSLGTGAAKLHETTEQKSLAQSDITLEQFTIAAKSINTIIIKDGSHV